VQEVEVVLDRLGGESVALLGEQVALDAGAVDLVERPAAEERREVLAQVATVVGDRRALTLHDALEVVDVRGAGLLDGAAGGAADDGRVRHQPPQLGLRLRARQAVGHRRPALQAEAPLDAPASHAPRPVPGLATGRIGPTKSRPEPYERREAVAMTRLCRATAPSAPARIGTTLEPRAGAAGVPKDERPAKQDLSE